MAKELHHLTIIIPALHYNMIARYDAEDINADSYLALGMDESGTPCVFFVNNPHAPVVPSHINSAVVIFGPGLLPLIGAACKGIVAAINAHTPTPE